MMSSNARKRSLASMASFPTGLASFFSNLSWIAAAFVFLGSLLVDLHAFGTFAFVPIQSPRNDALLVFPLLTRMVGSLDSPRNCRYLWKGRQTHSTRYSTVLDNDMPSIALPTSSILEEERQQETVNSFRQSQLLHSRDDVDKRSNIASSRQQIFDQISKLSSPTLHATSSGTKLTKKRGRMVRPRNQSSSTRKKPISRSGRTLHIEDAEHEDITQHQRLLTREEECELTHKIRCLRRAVRVRDAMAGEREEWSAYHPSSCEDDFPTEHQWAQACGLSVVDLRRVMSEGQESRSILVSANVGLVSSIAKRHYYALKQAIEAGGGVGTILTLQDMIQEGNLGLMKAAERFDECRGFRFSTYATYWIRQRILMSISDSSRVIRLPAHGKS